MHAFLQSCIGKSVLVIILSITTTQGQQQQFISVYNSSSCGGVSIFNTSGNSNYTVPAQTSSLYLKVNGLWIVESCNTTACSGRSVKSGQGQSSCSLQSTTGSINKLVFTRLGDLNQNESTIHFFPEAALLGTPTTASEAGLNGRNFTSRSYYFTGPNSWALNGGDQCLTFTSASIGSNRYGITYSLISDLQIQSVKLGCNVTITPTTTISPTTPIRSTSTIKPTTINPATSTSSNVNSTKPGKSAVAPIIGNKSTVASTFGIIYILSVYGMYL